MFQIDDKFLASLGLEAMPQAEKEKMKAHIYETLEMRVGMRLASNMSDQQLTEFEGFMSGDVTKATDYLTKLNPNWQNDQAYQNSQKQAQAQGINPDNATSEYAALKWLETNFPDYKKVVAEELEKLKNEIKQAAPQILADLGGQDSASTVSAQPQAADEQPIQQHQTPQSQDQPQQPPQAPPQQPPQT